jgi:hypothetical protein
MTPVMTALNFIRVIYDPEGDGEEAERRLTLIKVKSKVLGYYSQQAHTISVDPGKLL